MNDVTRRGVYNNIKLSPYKVKVGSLEFFFSSAASYRRFGERLSNDIQRDKAKLSKMFGVQVCMDEITALTSYIKAETRNFYVLYNGEQLWLDKIEFDGKLVKKKNLEKKSETLTSVE